MKTLILILLTFSLSGQVCKVTDLPALLKKAETDSVAKIERLAALKFHKLINEYRVKNGKKPLRWSDTLWIAARNHDLWMAANNRLMHAEFTPHAYFTGEEPDERTLYVLNFPPKEETWRISVAENAIWGFSDSGKNIEEITTNMARSAFKIWKDDAPHDANMLGYHHEHGVAFILGGSKGTWGTDDFD